MIRLLQLELYKMARYRPFMILLLTYFIILLGIGALSHRFTMSVGEGQEPLTLKRLGAYDFPVIWQIGAYFGLIFKLFLGILIVFNITNEFSFKTIKQNLIDGLSKEGFLASKVLGAVVFALLSTCALSVMIIVLGNLFSTSNESFFKGMEFMAYYFLNLSAFFSILIFLSLLFKRSVIVILVICIWWAVEMMINSIESIGEVIGSQEATLSENLPMNALNQLVTFPIFDIQNFMMGKAVFTIEPTDMKFVILSIVYFLVFSALSYVLLKRKDL